MFNKGIYTTALTGETADRLFSNITDYDTPDHSFLATLRALLRKRLPADKTVYLSCKKIYHTLNDILNLTTSQSIYNFIPVEVQHQTASGFNIFGHNIFIVHTVNPDAGEKMLEIIQANTGTGKRYMSGYTRREDLHIFYARKLKALFYTDDTQRNTVIFTNNLELKHFHALQMMIPKYLPLLFIDKPLTDEETALLKSCGSKSAVEYETLIGEYAKDLDIRAEIIRSKLAGFETASERLRITEIKNEITGHRTNYEIHLSSLRELSKKIEDSQYILAGLECSVNNQSGDSELMEFFMCNKSLNLIRVTGTTLEFVVHGYADVYDEDAFNKYVGNLDGFMYTNINSAVTKPHMEKLYRAVFGGRYKLRMCAAYTADMKTGLRAYQHYSFTPESMNYFPNPHIQKHGCIGTYAGRFQEYMQRKDYVGAISQAVVSARNINFYDSPVITGLGHNLSFSQIKCIEKPDGALLTPLELINELEGTNYGKTDNFYETNETAGAATVRGDA